MPFHWLSYRSSSGGFVGFEGFTDCRSASQRFAHDTGLQHPERLNLRRPEGGACTTCQLPGLVGFVGFEGFANSRSTSKRFAKGTGLLPDGTHIS